MRKGPTNRGESFPFFPNRVIPRFRETFKNTKSPTSNSNGRGGRSASYRISVQSNNNLLIGSAYTKQMGLKAGDEFEITLGKKHIHLKQLDRKTDDMDEETA